MPLLSEKLGTLELAAPNLVTVMSWVGQFVTTGSWTSSIKKIKLSSNIWWSETQSYKKNICNSKERERETYC